MQWSGSDEQTADTPVGSALAQANLYRLRFIVRLVGSGRMSEGLDGQPWSEAERAWRDACRVEQEQKGVRI